MVASASDNGTVLAFRKLALVRMLKNDFALRAVKAETEGWNVAQLEELLGKKRERAGIFEGDDAEGEMEAGQSAGLGKRDSSRGRCI